MIQSTEYRILNTGLWNRTRDAEHLIHDGWIRIQETEQRTGYRNMMQNTEYRTQNTGCRTLEHDVGSGYRIQNTGFTIHDTVYRLQDIWKVSRNIFYGYDKHSQIQFIPGI